MKYFNSKPNTSSFSMPLLWVITLSVASLLFTSCSTPQTRIKNNPQIFQNLPKKHQSLVSKGMIDLGMSPDAVYLAMGSPDSQVSGNLQGKNYMRWDYSVLMPVYTHHMGGFYGTGCYYHGSYYGSDYGTSVTYVPVLGSSIFFKKNKVVGWERRNR